MVNWQKIINKILISHIVAIKKTIGTEDNKNIICDLQRINLINGNTHDETADNEKIYHLCMAETWYYIATKRNTMNVRSSFAKCTYTHQSYNIVLLAVDCHLFVKYILNLLKK